MKIKGNYFKAALFAWAAAAMPSATHAQGNVTLYGVADVAVQVQSKTANDAGRGFLFLDGGWGPSLFGMRGDEDLGGGLKMSFKLESGYSMTNGGFAHSNGGMFGRQAYLEFSGGFGSLSAGVQFSPFFLSVVDSDARHGADSMSAEIPYLDNFGINGLFESNTIIYTTPDFSGLSGSFQYVPGGVPGSAEKGRRLAAAINYKANNILLTSAYYDARDPVTGLSVNRGITLGAGYTFRSLTVKAAYTNYKNPSSSAPLANIDVIGAGAEYIVSPAITVNGGVYWSKDKDVSGNHSMLYALGGQYFLSKRTNLYLELGLVDNHGDMRTTLAANAPASFKPPAGTTVALNLGMRHAF